MIEIAVNNLAASTGARTVTEEVDRVCRGCVIDSRQVEEGTIFVAFPGEKVDGNDFASRAIESGAGAVVMTHEPDAELVSLAQDKGCAILLTDDPVEFLLRLAHVYRLELGCLVVGITGSIGKTTTKDVLAAVLAKRYRVWATKGNFNNLIGMPLTVLSAPADTEVLVLEMGMNHFGEMAYLTSIARPDIAIITNIGTMHIEHLGSREGILQAKLEIFRGVPKNGVGVFNGDEPLLWNVRADGGHKKYYFGIENHTCDVLATDIQELEDGMRFVVSGFGHRFELFVPVLGRHTVYNALAAVTAALLLKIPPETIQAQISGFQNTGMRQKIYERDGFTIIEDCYNAGPESTEAALDILAGFRARAKGRCIAVLGDMLELGNRSAAEHYRIGRIAAAKVDMLYTYGTNSERMVSGAITGGMKQKFVEHFDTHEDLAHMLKMRARPGDVILFKGSRGMRMEKALSLFLKEEES